MSGALVKDRQARREVWPFDVGDKAGGKALAEAILEVTEVTRKPVAADHQLAAGVIERVEGVKQLLLAARLPLEELDVVDQQHVDAAEAPFELLEVACGERRQEGVGELFGRRVAHGEPATEGGDVVADRMEQVRLAETRGAVDEQRVVGLRGHFGDGQRSGVGEAVGRPDDELLEGVLRVQRRQRVARGARRVGQRRRRGPVADGNRHSRPEHGGGRVGEGPGEALRSPRRNLRRPGDGQRVAVERYAAQRRKPEAIGPLTDALTQRPLDLLPDVVELGGHGVQKPPGSGLNATGEGGKDSATPGFVEYSGEAGTGPRSRAHLAGKTGARYTRRRRP